MVTQEQTEWDAVNRMLQHHGFKPVRFADPTENKNLADLVLLEKTSAAELLVALRTTLTDSERRQALVQELIRSNAGLKQEAEHQRARAARQSRRAEELEGVLSGVKVKVQGLEDSIISKAAHRQGQLQRLQQDKRDVEALQQELSTQKELVSRLQRKLHQAAKEEENRVARQNRASRRFHLQLPGDQLCTTFSISDGGQRCGSRETSDDSDSSRNGDASASTLSSYKALLESYQEQLKKIERRREELKTEIRRLKLDLESRPEDAAARRAEAETRRLADDRKDLEDLQRSVGRPTRRLPPRRWEDRTSSRPDRVNVEDVTRTADTPLEEIAADSEVLQSPTKPTLLAMVSHFQKLFDAPSPRGVYPRTNEVYTRLAETNNAMRNLRDILDMDEAASPGDVVNAVAGVATGQHRLNALIESADIDRDTEAGRHFTHSESTQVTRLLWDLEGLNCRKKSQWQKQQHRDRGKEKTERERNRVKSGMQTLATCTIGSSRTRKRTICVFVGERVSE
ncbi:centrosomal protein of 70 kDa isoform X3 [Trichomycterus rosablanca]|uniref:centrosomal protein of 70 kDa isoform X3 n=1 Tax=Trichomycterus rosablanca TaxID=2290929 RepID=UPI002F35507A